MTERVSDADLEGVISFYESEYRHNRSVYAPDIEVVMPPELLLAREVRELRQLARDVAANHEQLLALSYDQQRWQCPVCFQIHAIPEEIEHKADCMFARAVELTQEVQG